MAFLSCKPLNNIPNTKNTCVFLLMLVWWFLMTITLSPPPVLCIPTGTKPGITCKEIERQALLTLKVGLVDKSGRLSSWSDDNPNCCHWKGVSCTNPTGHVFKLNLRNPFPFQEFADPEGKNLQYSLVGEISSSLSELKYLEYLDLSQNHFTHSKIPPFLGSLEELRYLNLSSSSFSGVVPPYLGNLSRLEYLDFGGNTGLEVGSLQWLTGMSSLTHLNLDGVDLSKAEGVDDWLGAINKLPTLMELHLRGCGLSNLPMSINHHPINFTTSLSILDLSSNNFSSSLSMPPWLFNLTGLVDLHLSHCSLAAPFNIPHEIGRLVALQQLDLSDNDGIGGQLPTSLGNLTNLVTMNLRNNILEGDIHEFIDGLATCSSDHPHLETLDLSCNKLLGTLPSSLGNLTNLVTLNLGSNRLEGRIPATLGHLCKLRELDLSQNRLEGDTHDFIDSLATCSSDHPHLETLDLSSNKLFGTLPSSLGNLTNLVTLNLGSNRLEGRIPATLGHLCKLRELDLSQNRLEGDTHDFIDGLATCSSDHPHLETLVLSSNKLLGTLPSSLGSLENLVALFLLENSFCGSIPTTIGSLTALMHLNLGSNKMNGTIAETIGRLPKLLSLDLSGNQWRAQMLNESHFEKHTELKTLDLSSTSKEEGNLLIMNVTQDWLPPFRRSLSELRIDGVKMSSKKFPRWTQTLLELALVSLVDCGISDYIPSQFWTSCPKITELDLSSNAISICRTFKNIVPAGNLYTLYLANISFGNGGGGGCEIPSNIDQLFPSLQVLVLSLNSLSVEIPRSISRLQSLRHLSLRNNVLTGELTHLHWENLASLEVLAVSNNTLVGHIPKSLGHLENLRLLLLNDNNLEGEIPASTNLTQLQVLDLGGNKLRGNIPPTLAINNPRLLVFRLRGNMLSGTIPMEFCLLSQLQTLDLAHNRFTGTIPWCLGNLSTTNHVSIASFSIVLVVKGREYKYDDRNIGLVHLVDLSHNKLSGNIPESLTNLTLMQNLNLSMNHLTGEIPSNIGVLQNLETLYLSQNHLSGPIPSSISDISFLNHLNVSHNNLSRRIPYSGQLQTLGTNYSSYDGNPLLCGDPLPTQCPGDGTPKDHPGEGEEEAEHGNKRFDIQEWGFVLSIVLGFAVGFWGVCGSLVLKASWREAYFGYLAGVKDKIIVVVVVNFPRLRRKMGISE